MDKVLIVLTFSVPKFQLFSWPKIELGILNFRFIVKGKFYYRISNLTVQIPPLWFHTESFNLFIHLETICIFARLTDRANLSTKDNFLSIGPLRGARDSAFIIFIFLVSNVFVIRLAIIGHSSFPLLLWLLENTFLLISVTGWKCANEYVKYIHLKSFTKLGTLTSFNVIFLMTWLVCKFNLHTRTQSLQYVRFMLLINVDSKSVWDPRWNTKHRFACALHLKYFTLFWSSYIWASRFIYRK